eukprot:403362001
MEDTHPHLKSRNISQDLTINDNETLQQQSSSHIDKQSSISQQQKIDLKNQEQPKNQNKAINKSPISLKTKKQKVNQNSSSIEQIQDQEYDVENPQILETSKVQPLKTSTFDFQKLRKNNRRRANKSSLGGYTNSEANNTKQGHLRNVSNRTQSRGQSQSSKHRHLLNQSQNLPSILNNNCQKFEDYVKNQAQSQTEDDILSKSHQNQALTSARLQTQEFNSKLKQAHTFAMDTLKDLADHNQNNSQAAGKLYPITSVPANHDQIVKVNRSKNESDEDDEEENESPLRAMQIARRQSILKQKGLLNPQNRRESFFGSQHLITPDPLQKLLQTKKYLNSESFLQQQINNGLMTERIHSRRDSNKETMMILGAPQNITTLSLANNKNGSSHATSSFKNELLQKTLNNQQNGQNGDKSYIVSGLQSRTKTPEISNRRQSQALTVQDLSQHPQYLKYRDRLFLKTLDQQPHQVPAQKSHSFITQADNKHFQNQKTQNNNHNQSLIVFPDLGKSASSMINDTVQQALIIDHINDYNKDNQKYNSVLIHLGVLLKKAISTAEHNQTAMHISKSQNELVSIPSYFLTTICTQIFDKISLFFPQFSKILVPLKNTLFQSIYYNYDARKHYKEDEMELEKTKNDLDLTKKDAKIKVKFLRYETYHDKLYQILKANKDLKRDILRMKKDHEDEQKQRKIIKNFSEKFKKMRTRETLKKVFTSLRFHSNSKYQGLFSQVISNAILGQDIRNKTTQRKYLMEWKLYAKESKLRRAKKEIEYYQNKNDDLDDSNSNQKMQIRDLLADNNRLKILLQEKIKLLQMHENEMNQFQLDNSRKKPIQIKQCLKVYFKYMFTNPLISRLRIHRPIALFALSHQKQDLQKLQQQESAIYELSNQTYQSPQKIQKPPITPVDMTLLLKKKELLQEGGLGLSILFNMSLRDIMLRWVNYMIEKAILKVNPIIEILKEEVRKQKEKRAISRQSNNNQSRSRSRAANNGLRIRNNTQNSSKNTNGYERSSSSSDGQDDSSENEDLVKDQDNDDDFGVQLGLLPDNKGDFFNDYQPFKNYKQDLKLLLTFKAMISKLVTDFCNYIFFFVYTFIIELNMIHDGVLQAVLFVIDQSERQIEILVQSTLPNLLHKQSSLGNHNQQPQLNKSTSNQNNSMIKPFQFTEDNTEEITLPDYKYILSYVNNTNIEQRAKLLIEQIEKAQHQKFDWYFSLSELLTGREQNYTTLLLFLFYNFPCLESNNNLERPIHTRSPNTNQKKLSEIMSSKHSQNTSEQAPVNNEQKLNLQVYKKTLYISRQKIMPLLMRKVNSNLHDVSLLYSIEELNKEGSNALQQLLELPFLTPKQLMIRWVNHLLRSFHEFKLQHELESKFKNKFVVEKSSSKILDSETGLNSNNSPVRSGIRQSMAQNAITTKLQNQNSISKKSNIQDSTKKQQQQQNSINKKRATSQNTNQKQNHQQSKDQVNKFRVDQLSKTQTLMKQFKLNNDLGSVDLGFEITTGSQLSQDSYYRLIVILCFLSPETLWDMFDMDYREIIRQSHFIEVVEEFMKSSSFDEKCLFVLNAVTRITKKNNLISMNDMYLKGKIKYTDLLIELFLSRPYLLEFNKVSYDEIDTHISTLKSQRQELTESFAFIQDCDKIYTQIKEKLLLDKLNYPNPHTIIARQMNIFERNELLLSDIEKSIINLNKPFLFQLLTFRQASQGAQWSQQIEDVIRKYMYPIRRYLNIYIDKEGFITYFDMWRAIKSINIRTFVVDSRDIENILIKILKLKDTKVATKRGGAGMNNGVDDNSGSLGFSGSNDIGDGFDQEAELFIKKIKSEIQYTVFSSKRGGSSQRFRTKSSIVKEIEESLENVYIKTQLYRAKFQASDLIIVLIAILFRQNPSEFVNELTILSPFLYDEGVKNVNKMLSKEKIQMHVEAYLTEYQPSILFEQFLIHNVLIKSDFAKKHPFRINMMKDDFRAFLDHYLNSLFGVFDFYLHEYAHIQPQHIKYKHFCIQVEAVYGLLRDFNAFNTQESGLTKNSLKKILVNVQRQIGVEQQKQINMNNLRSVNNGGVMDFTNITQQSVKTTQNPLTTSGQNFFNANNQTNLPRSQSPFSNSNRQNSNNNNLLGNSVDNAFSQQLVKEGAFDSLVFFEFMECLYLVSQYYNPDPFVNQNQKFADFLERQVFVNIQFKIKSKRLQDSPHKKNLIKSLQSHKVIRGANLETFNNYFELQ